MLPFIVSTRPPTFNTLLFSTGIHGLWSSLNGVIFIPAYALSYEYRTALESPELAQNIVFLSNKTETQVEPLKLKN